MNKIVEMIVGDNWDLGVFAISVVEDPAIQENFIYMNAQEDQTIKMSTVDEEQQILMGAVLIPDLKIFRLDDEGQGYDIWFSKDTVNEVAHRYLIQGNQSESTLEHEVSIEGLSVVESWIIEDDKFDKSRKYGLKHPVGTWMVKMKVNNESIWSDYVKTGAVKGFSIEGKFGNNVNMKSVATDKYDAMSLSELQDELEILAESQGYVDLETYTDYPQAIKDNAARGIRLNEENGNKCATQTGKIRAQQLAQGKGISLQTVKRMKSYLSRAKEYYNADDTTACGTISYLLWGGEEALGWSTRTLEQAKDSE